MDKSSLLYRRTAPQYRQSTRKIGLRALVTRKCDVCLTSTTMASTNCRSKTHVCTTRRRDTISKKWKRTEEELELQEKCKTGSSSKVTFTIVLLCLMKVWKPNQRSFMHSSNATITNASSSRVAWTCKIVKDRITGLPVGPQCLLHLVFLSFTHINIQAQRGHGRSLAQRQHHEQKAGQQLHHIEQVVVGKQVGRQRFGVSRVGEELVVVLTLLMTSFKWTNQYQLSPEDPHNFVREVW